jgi:hypothetical protein
MIEFVLGNLVRCTTTFRNTANAVADPTAITFKFKTPAGAITTYTYGVDQQLVKDSTGVYHVDLTANAVGTWNYRFAGTGTVVAATEGDFAVPASQFP